MSPLRVERGGFAQALRVGEAPPVTEHSQAEAGQHILHRRGIGAGAPDRTGGGQRLDQPALLLERRSRNELHQGRQGIVSRTEPDLAAVGREGENRLTRRVKHGRAG